MSEYVFRSNTSIGNLDAETDNFLQNCFIETEAYKTFETFDENVKRILVGRTGTGKTALLKYIKMHADLLEQQEIEAETTIFNYIKNNKFINGLLEQGVDLKIFFKALWNHVILVKILTLLKEKQSFFDNLTKKHKEMAEYVETYGEAFFSDNALNIITERFQTDMEGKVGCGNSFNIVGKKVEDKGSEIQVQTNEYVNKTLLSKQKKIIDYLSSEFKWDKQKKLFITVDDLDKSWISDIKIKYKFIDSLLDSIRDFLKLSNLKTIISIRTDILEGVYKYSYRQEEKDFSLILPIEWSKNEIKTLLNKRISHLLKDKYRALHTPVLEDVFNFKIKKQNAVDYILNRTMLRPRDAIDFVNKCFQAADGQALINEDNVLKAEEFFFVSRKNALRDEWKALYPAIDKYIDVVLKFIHKQTFKISHIDKEKAKDEVISSNASSDRIVDKALGNDENFMEELLSVLFEIGVIGIKLSSDNILYSTFNKRHLDVSDFSKEFFVHPLFWRK